MTGFDSKRQAAMDKLVEIQEELGMYDDQKPEQKPVAWMVYTQDGQSVYVTDNPTDIPEGQRALPLYATPQPEQSVQEPLPKRRWKLAPDGFGLQRDDVVGNYVHIDDCLSVLHTTPPKRPWVGLTDAEAQWLYDNCRTPANLIDMTEAKLKEKNFD